MKRFFGFYKIEKDFEKHLFLTVDHGTHGHTIKAIMKPSHQETPRKLQANHPLS